MSAIEFLGWGAPALGAATDIIEDLRWIRLPVPGSLGHINVWLAPGHGGRVLIDTGMNQPETHAAWEGLERRERLDRELEAIVVTHHHPDHFGMAGALAARFGVPVRMSAPARAAALRALAPGAGSTPARLAEYRETWGIDFESLLVRARAAGVFDRLVSGMPAPSADIADEERIAELRDPWRASLHFGHAEGHACLHWSEAKLMISGDQLLPSISSNISLYPGAGSEDPLGDFFASLERLAALPADTVVLPAHGQPFRGAATRAAQLRAMHEGRLGRLTDFAREPRSIPQVVGELFAGRNIEGWNALLAYGETLAHVRYLHVRGVLTRLADNGTVRWVRS